jgi:hypothetical protein
MSPASILDSTSKSSPSLFLLPPSLLRERVRGSIEACSSRPRLKIQVDLFAPQTDHHPSILLPQDSTNWISRKLPQTEKQNNQVQMSMRAMESVFCLPPCLSNLPFPFRSSLSSPRSLSVYAPHGSVISCCHLLLGLRQFTSCGEVIPIVLGSGTLAETQVLDKLLRLVDWAAGVPAVGFRRWLLVGIACVSGVGGCLVRGPAEMLVAAVVLAAAVVLVGRHGDGVSGRW